MKKTSGIIVLIILIIAIIFGLGYTLATPDGWDRFVGTVTDEDSSRPEPTDVPVPVPSAPPAGDHELVVPDKPDKSDKNDPEPTATPAPSPSRAPTASPSAEPTATPEPSQPDEEKTEYEKYIEMSGEEQQKVFESYENPQDFFKWYNNAKAEYDAQNESTIIEGGSINLEDYLKDDGDSSGKTQQ